jgi:hypothetical protein
MDRIPGKLPNTASRLIAMAASMLGSVEEVMAVMKSTEADFIEYCAGRKEPRWDELDRLIFLIVAEQQKLMVKNRQLLDAHREKKES